MAEYANPDALGEDEWWLDRGDLVGKGGRKRTRNVAEDEGRVQKRTRKKITEILAVTEVGIVAGAICNTCA